MRYMKGKKSEELVYRRYDKLELNGFSDFDSSVKLNKRKSTIGYCFKLENSSGAISWASKFQKRVSTTTFVEQR